MGFTASEIRKLTFKVQAANVIDADSGAFWYQSKLENSPAVKSERILTQYTVVKSNLPTGATYVDQIASLETLVEPGNVLENIVGNAYSTGPAGTIISSRLSRVTLGLNNTWISYNTYNDPSSGPKDLWINPASVPAANGDPTQGYTIQLYSGDPNAGGVKITTSVGQDADEVGWVWNYDMGVLFLANNLITLIQGDAATYPAGLDFYVRGWRYVGTTGAGSGGAVAIEDGGVNVTTAVSKINFTGTGVTVTGSGTGNEDIEVAISGGLGSYTNATPTPQPFPGNSPFDNIPTGETFSNETFEAMMNKMLYPTLNPTLTAPSATLSISPSASFQEIGANVPVTLNATFNQGSINPQYTSASNKRSGLPNTYNFNGTGVSPVVSTSLAESATTGAYTILAGANTWTNSVSFDAGVMPKDSVGGDFDPPGALSAGTTSTISRTITGVFPVFATTSSISTMTKQSLVSMSGYATVSLVAESFATGAARQTVDIPIAGGGQAGWSTITIVEFFNTFSNQWGASALSDWTTSATTHEVPAGSGNIINYTRFTNNAGYPRGAGQYRFKS